ncbi:MAG TPA: hypothetical protein VNY33_02330 [Gaiellaceae bacterium]|nr:hypothetical protein [Gaiellaceae bacterium]
MRRTVVIWASLAALAAPATAFALHLGPGDGTLVVQNGSAPKGVAVVTLAITGVAIGQISGYGRVVIDDPTGDHIPEVTNYVWHRSSGTEETWAGNNFRFRAVGGTYKITVYGQDIDLVASGQGSVVLTGWPDAPATDGHYSLNGQDFRSLPATPTKLLRIFAPTSATG